LKITNLHISSVFNEDKKNIFILLGLWILFILIINPIGNFPLNDDWAYAKVIINILELGRVKFIGWMGMTLFAHVVWGAAVSKVFGFSFTILRFSTLIFGFLGVLYSYKIIRLFAAPVWAFIGALLVFFNPMYFNLSYSYMTDVPFFMVGVISIYNLHKYVDNQKLNHFFTAILFASVAVLIRQLGLAIGVGFLLYGFLLIKTEKRVFYISVLFFVCQLGVFMAYQILGEIYIGFPGRFHERGNDLLTVLLESPVHLVRTIINRGIVVLLYMSIFISPFLVIILKPNNILKSIFVTCSAFGLFILLYFKGHLFPVLENMIHDFGVGPKTLYDFLHFENPYLGEEHFFWKMLTFVSCVLFIGTLAELFTFKKLFSFIKKRFSLPLIISIVYISVAGSVDCFDRYFIFPIPLIFAFLAGIFSSSIQPKWGIFSIFFIPIALFTVFATHDYFSWNRARWQAIDYLLNEEKVHQTKIDGGFEYNGWFNYNEEDFPSGLQNLWVHNVDYIITFTHLPDTELYKEFTYSRWLHFDTSTIKILKKEGGFPPEYVTD
jgi:hypothetical protein